MHEHEFPFKRAWCHQSFTQWHGHLILMSLLKRYTRALRLWVRFQAPDSERAQGSMHNHRVLQCVPVLGLPGILNQEGLYVLVYCSFIVCVPWIDWALVLMTVIYFGSHWESVPTSRILEYQWQGPLSLISVDRGLQLLIRVYLIICTTLTYIP